MQLTIFVFYQILSEEHSIHTTAAKLWNVPVIFNETKIELDISDHGIKLEDGWELYPVCAPVVSCKKL